MNRGYAALFLTFTVVGCYSLRDLPEERPIYVADADQPPREVGECLRNQFILRRYLALDMAYDENTGIVHLTRARSNPPLYLGITVLPRTPSGSSIELRRRSLVYGGFDDDALRRIVDLCRSESQPVT